MSRTIYLDVDNTMVNTFGIDGLQAATFFGHYSPHRGSIEERRKSIKDWKEFHDKHLKDQILPIIRGVAQEAGDSSADWDLIEWTGNTPGKYITIARDDIDDFLCALKSDLNVEHLIAISGGKTSFQSSVLERLKLLPLFDDVFSTLDEKIVRKTGAEGSFVLIDDLNFETASVQTKMNLLDVRRGFVAVGPMAAERARLHFVQIPAFIYGQKDPDNLMDLIPEIDRKLRNQECLLQESPTEPTSPSSNEASVK